MHNAPILTINSGSSSLKLGLFIEGNGEEHILFDVLADGIGKHNGKLEVRNEAGNPVRSEALVSTTQEQALDKVACWFGEMEADEPAAIGHRVVHGGPHLTTHQRISLEVLDELQRSVHFAPLHIPSALRLIKEAQKIYPKVPHFACFDTAFHRTLPEAAARFALPSDLFLEGVRRYGFHGLSYASIVRQLSNELPPRVVIAHLGNGASLAAVEHGLSVDTTMGLTPTGGIPMGTRTGDLDPGVLLHLMRIKQMAVDALEDLLNHDSGLVGLSGHTSDMRDLQASADRGSAPARLAIEVFCRSIRKTIAAFAAVLQGLDLLVFTGGIGEHSAKVRSSACDGLDFLGIQLDRDRNEGNATTISTETSKCRVAVIPSEEDREIACHCRELMHS
jgi:acetate kinase